MTVYAWKEGSRLPLDAQVAGKELHRLQRQNDGITPPAVVESAKDDASPLHPAFEWDDRAAAYEYRLTQARYLLRSLVITDPTGEEQTIRAFVVVQKPDEKGEVYLDTLTVFRDDDLRRQALDRAMNELQAFSRKYAGFEELAEVLAAIKRIKVPA